jgi:histidine triad (HIT) family protein
MDRRVPFDVGAYAQRTRTGGCFICAMQRGDPGHAHELIAANARAPTS